MWALFFAYQKTADLCTWHYDKKKNASDFSILKKFVFFKEKIVTVNSLVAECMNDIASHLASCHLSKCSKVKENEVILARVTIRQAW